MSIYNRAYNNAANEVWNSTLGDLANGVSSGVDLLPAIKASERLNIAEIVAGGVEEAIRKGVK